MTHIHLQMHCDKYTVDMGLALESTNILFYMNAFSCFETICVESTKIKLT